MRTDRPQVFVICRSSLEEHFIESVSFCRKSFRRCLPSFSVHLNHESGSFQVLFIVNFVIYTATFT